MRLKTSDSKALAIPTDYLLMRFHESVMRNPGKTAVIYQNQKLSYEAFNFKINQTAHFLIKHYPEHFSGGNSPHVAVLGEDKLAMLILQFALLKLNAAYVPLDNQSPLPRIQYILQSASPVLVLSSDISPATRHVSGALANFDIPLVDITQYSGEIDDFPTRDIYLHSDNENPAYILYTSGSTAKAPKGVLQTRKGIGGQIANYTRDMNITDADALLQLAVFSHDQAIVDYYAALLNGATLCLYDITSLQVSRLHQFMNDNQVTIFSAIPSIFSLVFDGISKNALPSLRVVTIGGEETRLSHLKLYQDSCPDDCLLINGYGATECSWALFFVINKDFDISLCESVPLGKPTKGLDIYLGESNCEAPNQYELCIGGDYVSPGYYRNPEANAGAFVEIQGKNFYRTGDIVTINPDQSLNFAGRMQWHEKIHGKRINLHEIESLLQKIVDSEDCIVMTGGEEDRKKIYAFVDRKNTIPKETILQEMKQVLPAYMIPFDIRFIPDLPKLPNGKVDRQNLKQSLNLLISRYAEVQNPQNDPEDILEMSLSNYIEHVWCTTLGISPGSEAIRYSFEDVGGDSLAAMIILNKIRQFIEKKFGFSVELNKSHINNTLKVLISHTLDLHSKTGKMNHSMGFQASTLPKAHEYALLDYNYGYNLDYNGVSFNYEGICVLAEHFNKKFDIHIKPTPSWLETIQCIGEELRAPTGPGQIGFLILRSDTKNSHPSPAVLVINRQNEEAKLFIADSIGSCIVENPVILNLKKQFPKLEIGFDPNPRQNDDFSCYPDAIHYLCEALRVDMLEETLITGKQEDYFLFISPAEVFKNTQSPPPSALNQDKILKNDEKNRSLREYLKEHTLPCRFIFNVNYNQEVNEGLKVPLNVKMYQIGQEYKGIIEAASKKLEEGYLALQFKTRMNFLSSEDHTQSYQQIVLLEKKALMAGNFMEEAGRVIHELLDLPAGVFTSLLYQRKKISSLQELLDLIKKTESRLDNPLQVTLGLSEADIKDKIRNAGKLAGILSCLPKAERFPTGLQFLEKIRHPHELFKVLAVLGNEEERFQLADKSKHLFQYVNEFVSLFPLIPADKHFAIAFACTEIIKTIDDLAILISLLQTEEERFQIVEKRRDCIQDIFQLQRLFFQLPEEKRFPFAMTFSDQFGIDKILLHTLPKERHLEEAIRLKDESHYKSNKFFRNYQLDTFIHNRMEEQSNEKKTASEFDSVSESDFQTDSEALFLACQHKKGTNPGAIYTHQEGSLWLGKINNSICCFQGDEYANNVRKEISEGAAKEKIAFDLYALLSEASGHAFLVPESTLANLPVINPFNNNTVTRMISRYLKPEPDKIAHVPHIMSKYCDDYIDLVKAEVRNAQGEIVPYFRHFQNTGQFSDTIMVNDQEIPLTGLFELLAAARVLGDFDVIGRGHNTGFRLVFDQSGQLLNAEVIKIDAGEAFTVPSTSPEQEFLQNDPKNIQFGLGGWIPWSCLSADQKIRFMKAMKACISILKDEARINPLFHNLLFSQVTSHDLMPEEKIQYYKHALAELIAMQEKAWPELFEENDLNYSEQLFFKAAQKAMPLWQNSRPSL